MVESIKRGAFSMDGAEWRNVSDHAKEVIAGLLTVNAAQRLTLASLFSHPWLQPHSAPSVQLHTNRSLRKAGATERAINHTLKAFHEASQAGFALGDPTHAPLARKRRQKKDSTPRSPERDGGRPNRLELSPGRT